MKPWSISPGGERQAIAIAKAKYFGAKLLVLDEPTAALSIQETRKVLMLSWMPKQKAQGSSSLRIYSAMSILLAIGLSFYPTERRSLMSKKNKYPLTISRIPS